MEPVRPVLKKLLIAALALYVAANCILQADICNRISKIEHVLMHITGAHGEHP